MDFISDEQMRKLEAQGHAKPVQARPEPDFISDEDMDRFEKSGLASNGVDVLDSQGIAQASLEHFGNTAAQGYLPQLQAMAEKPMTKVLDALTGNNVAGDLPSYVERRDENLRRIEDEARSHPTASMLGSIGGAVTSAVGASGLAPINALSVPGRLAQAAGSGAVLGALSNPGDTEGIIDPLQIDERKENAKKGAVLGALGQGAGEGLSKALDLASKFPGVLKKLAERKAFKASGAMLKDFRKAEGQDRLQALGRRMLDEGLIKPGYSFEDIAETAGKLKATKGKEIGGIIDEVEALFNTGRPGPMTQEEASRLLQSSFSPQKASQELSEEIMPRLESAIGGSAEVAKVQGYLDDLASKGNSMDIRKLQTTKQATDNLFNEKDWFTEGKPAKEALKAIRSRLKKAVETEADTIDAVYKGGQGGKLKAANQAWGDFNEVNKIAKDRVLRENGNQLFGLGDRNAALGGIALGAGSGIAEGDIGKTIKYGLLGAAAGGVGSKLARNYGNPIAALGADKVSKILSENPNLLGKFAQPLVEASKKGPAAFSSTLYMLNKDPKFKEQVGVDSPNEVLMHPQLMQLFKQNPNLIDTLSNENLKQALRKHFNRAPADNQNQRIIPEEEAQKRFLEGN